MFLNSNILLEIPFYQTHWHGIDLRKIAAKVGLEANVAANADFYKCFYEDLKFRSFELDADWLAEKMSISNLMESYCKSVADSKSLSVGAGLGIVETPLIEKGFNIDLQDCQPYSLEYCKSKIDKPVNFILSDDLSALPKEQYDFVFVIEVAYAIPTDALGSMFAQVYNVLKPGGKCMMLDCPYAWELLKGMIRNLIIKPNEVLWGKIRTPRVFEKLAMSGGLNTQSVRYLGKNMQSIHPKKIFGEPISRDNIKYTEMVFAK